MSTLGRIGHEEALADQQARARRLARQRECPHCHQPITRLDALSMVRGDGVVYSVRIRLPDGRVVPIDERQFSPQSMRWADD